MSERCFSRIPPLSILGLFSVSTLLIGCEKPPKEQSDTTEITVNVATSTVAAPTPKIQALPEKDIKSVAKKTYLSKYVSKITDDGVIGIPAGTEVTVKERVGDKVLITDGTVSLQVDGNFLTTDENVSSDIRDRDLRSRQLIETRAAANQREAYKREMALYTEASALFNPPTTSDGAKPANNLSAAEIARIRQRIVDLDMRIGTATQMQKLKKMAPSTYRGSFEGPESLKRERDRLKRLVD